MIDHSTSLQPLDIHRTVFLGDSITDGNTYQELIVQALGQAGIGPIRSINAGIGGDTAAGMRTRLDRDVFAHRPTLVTVSAGINDAYGDLTLEPYIADMRAIADEITGRGLGLVLFTTTAVAIQHARIEVRIEEYNAFLRSFAADRKLPIAEIYEPMLRARDAGEDILEPDGIHLSFAGYLVMTRAILDALGYPQLSLPADLDLKPIAGLMTHWKIRPAAGDEPLTESDAAALHLASDGWIDLELPCLDTAIGDVYLPGQWWALHEAKRGVAVKLDKLGAPATRYNGISEIVSPTRREALLSAGAGLQVAWVNGKRVYRQDGFRGWHPGRERVPVTLEAGANRLAIESTTDFFLSITDKDDDSLP